MADAELVSLERKRVYTLDAFLDVQRRHREQVPPRIDAQSNPSSSLCRMP